MNDAAHKLRIQKHKYISLYRMQNDNIYVLNETGYTDFFYYFFSLFLTIKMCFI